MGLKQVIELSVIIPAFNAENYILPCIESLLSSRIEKMEVLIVDDGSSDNTAGVCEGIEKSYKSVRVYRKPNGGSASARNLGLTVAVGQYICFIDSDDVVIPKEFRSAFAETRANHYDIGCFDMSIEDKVISCRKGETIWDQFISSPIYMHSMCNKFFSRRVIEGLFLDEDLLVCEDMLFCARAFANAKAIGYIHRTAYKYRMVSSSITHSTDNERKSKDDVKAAERIKESFAESNDDESLQRFVAYRYQLAALRYLLEPDVFSMKKYRSIIISKEAYKDLSSCVHRVLCWCANWHFDIIPLLFIGLKKIKYKILG